MTAINQKEYLKKYLGIGRVPGEKKKKKKKHSITGNSLKIIDDDADVLISREIQDDISAANEDAPQIVAVIDERPPSLRIDEQTKSKLWRPIGGTDVNTEVQTLKLNNSFKLHQEIKDNSDNFSLKKINKSLRGDNNSPPQRKIDRKGNREDDSSPPRKRQESDMSPPRNRMKQEKNDIFPPGKHRRGDHFKKSRWGDWSPEGSSEKSRKSDEKIRKTLDGKKAGLQNAKDLVKETTLLRHREDELFKNMSAEVSGMNATTVIREKSVRDVEEEVRKEKKEQETKKKYDLWGRGLAQVENQNTRIAEQLHEMSKPLARYANDEDLEKYLKEQEREGDPMLAYIRKKKKIESVAAGIPEKPMYMGEFMPNRFGICPGYRWDGVDRSNGYEKKWFQVQNSKKATQEEALKWSTEDM